MAARLRQTNVVAVRPGDLAALPAGINPLEPAVGPDGTRFPLQAHLDLVRALFLAAFRAEEPFPQVLSAALSQVYAEAGWDLVTGEPSVPGASYPTLDQLQSTALSVIDQIGYGNEIRDNVRGFVSIRIGSLRNGTTGRFLNGGFPLDYARLLAGNVVLEAEDCGDDADKAFIIGAVLIGLTEHLRMRAREEGPSVPQLRHLTVIEEAHRLLRRPPPGSGDGPTAHAVEMFASLLAESRAYGEGLVIAEQIPSKLIPDVIKNTAVKVVHRLPGKDDRDAVGATMNITGGQSRYLVTLAPGDAAVFADGMDYPVLARMPDGTRRELQPSRAAAPTAIVSPRSSACSGDCGAAPCTLGQIAAANQAITRDPRITLWAELSVLAHLLAFPVPTPSAEFAAAMARVDDRVLDCALAHAVEEAARLRQRALLPRVAPGPLAGHVVEAMRKTIAGESICGFEPEWLAPVAEWVMVQEQLDKAVKEKTPGRHPLSGEWERTYGQPIPGEDCAAQLQTVDAWQNRAWNQPEKRSITFFGSGTASAIEGAVGAQRASPDWRDEVRSAVEGTFAGSMNCWATDLLAPRPATDKKEPE